MAPIVAKSLSRLPRDALIDLCLKWTRTANTTPYLASNRNLLESEEEDYLHEPAENVAALKKVYSELKEQNSGKNGLSRQDIIDRIVDGDWRRGLSLQQLADIDFAALEHNDTALRWSALKLVPLQSAEADLSSHPAKKRKISHSTIKQPHYPSISPATFIANLKSHIAPLVKAHYTLHRLASPSKLAVLRLYIVPNTPFAPVSANVPRNVRQATDSSRVMYIALPDSCPYIYISLSGSTGVATGSKGKDDKASPTAKIDMAATKRVILEAIPKALSKPQERWSLENTKLTCRSLKSIGLLRGNARPGTSGGCYSKFSEEYEWKPTIQPVTSEEHPSLMKDETTNPITQAQITPLTVTQPPPPQQSDPESIHEAQVSTRFGTMTQASHAKLDRFHITLSNILASPPTSKQPPKVQRKRKRRSLEDIEAGRDEPVEVSTKQEPAPITLTFSGVDVFRGLKELALLEEGKYIDLNRLPAWMTGEKGVSGMTV